MHWPAALYVCVCAGDRVLPRKWRHPYVVGPTIAQWKDVSYLPTPMSKRHPPAFMLLAPCLSPAAMCYWRNLGTYRLLTTQKDQLLADLLHFLGSVTIYLQVFQPCTWHAKHLMMMVRLHVWVACTPVSCCTEATAPGCRCTTCGLMSLRAICVCNLPSNDTSASSNKT